MKTLALTVLTSTLMATSAQAAQFICLGNNYGDAGQEFAAGTITSETTIAQTNYGIRNATNGAATGVYIKNASGEVDADYHPIKYKDFNRYYIGSYGSGNGAISMALLLPKNLNELPVGSKFKAFASGGDTHGGGNSPLSCIIK